jgi:hypothetical protein
LRICESRGDDEHAISSLLTADSFVLRQKVVRLFAQTSVSNLRGSVCRDGGYSWRWRESEAWLIYRLAAAGDPVLRDLVT